MLRRAADEHAHGTEAEVTTDIAALTICFGVALCTLAPIARHAVSGEFPSGRR